MKPTWLDRSLVEAPFFYTLATNEKAFRKALRHLKVPRGKWPAFVLTPWSDATAHAFECEAKLTYVICIRLRDGLSMPQVAALVTHEAVHMWQAARERLGERHPSSEFEAYAVQALTQRLLEEYERQVKEKP